MYFEVYVCCLRFIIIFVVQAIIHLMFLVSLKFENQSVVWIRWVVQIILEMYAMPRY